MNLGVHMMNYVLPLFCLGSLIYASVLTMGHRCGSRTVSSE
jgi:hypothetical protein